MMVTHICKHNKNIELCTLTGELYGINYYSIKLLRKREKRDAGLMSLLETWKDTHRNGRKAETRDMHVWWQNLVNQIPRSSLHMLLMLRAAGVELLFLQNRFCSCLPQGLPIFDIRTWALYTLHVKKKPLAQPQDLTVYWYYLRRPPCWKKSFRKGWSTMCSLPA